MSRALLVGRFQPPHRGHLFAVQAAARRHARVLVGVGSAQHSHTPENPFTVGERFEMWTAALAEARLTNVHLYPLPDLHQHAAWVEHVRRLLPPFDVVITNNPLTRRLFTEAGHRVATGPLWRPEVCSGTKIRALWLKGADPSPLVPAAVARVASRLGARERVIAAEGRSPPVVARRG